MPNKQTLKDALGDSLQAEENAVEDRFSKADTVFKISSEKTTSDKPRKIQKTVVEKKEKVIRDSFTMPQGDHLLIGKIKDRCLKAGIAISKSEIIRAGIHILNLMPKEDLKSAFETVSKVKTGRPPKKG